MRKPPTHREKLWRARKVRNKFHTSEFRDRRDSGADKCAKNWVPIPIDAYCEHCGTRITTNRCLLCELNGRERKVLRLSRKHLYGEMRHTNGNVGSRLAIEEFAELDAARKLPALYDRATGEILASAVQERVNVMRTLKLKYFQAQEEPVA